MTILFTIRQSKEKEKELEANLERLQKKGYPKLGDKLIVVKSGNTSDRKFHVTKGKTYEVIDNIDLLEGYLHVKADDYGCVRLTPQILKEYFGVELK